MKKTDVKEVLGGLIEVLGLCCSWATARLNQFPIWVFCVLSIITYQWLVMKISRLRQIMKSKKAADNRD